MKSWQHRFVAIVEKLLHYNLSIYWYHLYDVWLQSVFTLATYIASYCTSAMTEN